MKTVGIIGGLGPETTAKFYQQIIASCFGENKQSRPPILIWSVPLPYKIEEDLIKRAQGEERYLPYLLEGAQWLEKGGADFLVIPCNSVHVFIDKIREAVKIPVLSIVEETVRFLQNNDINEVGILATTSLNNSGLYSQQLSSIGIKVLFPDEDEQQKIGKVIYHLVNYQWDSQDEKEMHEVLDSFVDAGVKVALLACTDLQLLNLKHPHLKIYDTMKILAEATTQEILS